jgi:hypothetical protein
MSGGYGAADKVWSEFGTEQQAKDWFVGSTYTGTRDTQKAFPPKNRTLSPYWRYLRDNVRVGLT